jgi:membrane protein required for colicin V production
MNGLDLAIVVGTGLGFVSGLGRGLLRMVSSIIALAGAIYFASVYYAGARDLTLKYVPVTPTAAAVIGYAAIFLIVLGIIQAGGAVLMRLIQTASLGWVDRLLGGAAGAAITVAIIGLVLMLLTAALPVGNGLLQHSELTPPVLDYTHALIAFIPPEVRTIYEHKRSELMRYWVRRGLEGQAAPTATATP